MKTTGIVRGIDSPVSYTHLGAEGQAQQTSGEPDAAQEQPVQYTDLPLDAEGYPVE